ncbi:hypothetical protein Y032_0006g3089 [Ancylostoma ceylanicum]|uniref:Uncharacterized protein n=1 Tax=Ancylostoma ceylanicum TaxID=53326 RepID=A0A016VQP6_9BILA|nr:hypothetical protein Y032_0006g3089 [Ancylostoma ceylanicum]
MLSSFHSPFHNFPGESHSATFPNAMQFQPQAVEDVKYKATAPISTDARPNGSEAALRPARWRHRRPQHR